MILAQLRGSKRPVSVPSAKISLARWVKLNSMMPNLKGFEMRKDIMRKNIEIFRGALINLAFGRRISVGVGGFVLGYSLLMMLLFQGPAFKYALSVTDLSNAAGWVTIASFEVLQLFLFFFLLYGVALISVRLMQAFAAVMIIINALALDFINSYNIEIDKAMIANVINTTGDEAGGLMTPALAAYAVFVAVLAVWGAARFKITPRRRWVVRVGIWLSAIAAFLGYVWAVSFTLLWFDQHAQRLGGRLLPWSYVINTVRHVQKTAFDTRPQQLLPDATFLAPVPDGQKDVVVLVIGEAARRANFGLYGYSRDTSPVARARGMIALQDGQTCATYTVAATACILSHQGAQTPPISTYEPLPSYLTRFGVETILRQNNSGTPPMRVTQQQWARDISSACRENCPDPALDAVLAYNLGPRIAAATSSRVFVLLHLAGSHGPAYFKKYPPEFERFTPVCKSVQLADCTAQEQVNAYDNSLLYTDYVLGQIIDEVAALPNARAVVMYISDHGQSLGENGFYLHGAPNAIAPAVQRDVPFLLWMSPQFMAAKGLSPAAIPVQDAAAADMPFHTVMGAFGMRSPVYKPQFDLFAPRP
jgi:lipid A ethanolaminephosphotransferase